MANLSKDSYSVEYFAEVNRLEKDQAERLADAVIMLYSPELVVDLGCATGLYVKPFVDKGVDAFGIELSPNAFDASVVQTSMIRPGDLRMPFDIGIYAEIVLCLEVMEHIEEEYADQLVENIVNAGYVLIVSPSPHGGGDYHHNPQPKQYWLDKFSEYGYHEVPVKSEYLKDAMKQGEHTNWIDNLMVLEKNDE